MKKTDLEKFHKEVTKLYLNCGKPLDKEREKYLQVNNYSTKYRLYNLDKKQFQDIAKKGFSFSDKSFTDQAKIWSYIFKNTEYLGIGSVAINHFKKFQNKKSHPLYQYWPLLKTWVSKIENWVHGDMLCSVYCDILSEDPKSVYPELKKWSQSKSPWKNRMAIVSLLYYYNPKRNLLPYKDIISLVQPHLKKDHYYLQKAIGWNLREVSSAYPNEYKNFMNDNLLNISSTAFSTAVEKIPKTNREPWKKRRAEARKQKLLSYD